ncbi:MAG: transposase family protein [Planctomycetia bacterium]|nr:transposase family protein [Planctomycetia bacterium]
MVFVRSLKAQVQKQLNNLNLTIQLRKETKPMKLSLKDAEFLDELLQQIPEHRMPRGVRHRKRSILAISICAIICNAWSFAAIAEWQSVVRKICSNVSCRYNTKRNDTNHRVNLPSGVSYSRWMQKQLIKSLALVSICR